MPDDQTEELLDRVIDEYLTHLDGEGPAPELQELPEDIRTEALAMMATISAARDPAPDEAAEQAAAAIAARLGFDRTGTISVDGHRVARERKRAGLDRTQLLDAMARAGHSLTMKWLGQLERSEDTPVPADTTTALVAVLGTSVASIEVVRSAEPGSAQAFINSPAFWQMVDAWAVDHDRDRQMLGEQARAALVGSSLRGKANDDAWRGILAEILNALVA